MNNHECDSWKRGSLARFLGGISLDLTFGDISKLFIDHKLQINTQCTEKNTCLKS